jgi:hypothetical protein
MDNSADSMQELLVSYVGKFVTIELRGSGKVSGSLCKVGGGIIVIKTDKGLKICKTSNIEEVDLPDAESETEPTQLMANGHQENRGAYPHSSSVLSGQALQVLRSYFRDGKQQHLQG